MDNMASESGCLVIRKEQAEAYGKKLSEAEFLVRAGSTAMREGTPKAKRNRPERDRLVQQGILVPDANAALFRFSQDHVFSSKSAAAGVVIDGNSNGDHWKEAGGSPSLAALVAQVTRRHIELAMDECDRNGLSAFLAEHEFGKPRVWALRNNHRYPAKATVAVAIQYLPAGPRFSAKTFFSGFGEKKAFARLEELGYELDRDDETLSRASVEAAMDAYENYRANDAHGEIFGAFGEPRDYWVRSSRDRDDRVFPTKPLIGFILGKTELNGGWGQKTDAAARLHNAGFIIVDPDDQPIERPERYEHLMEGADRIRLCAMNYFIEPAREIGLTKVSVRAKELRVNFGLRSRTPEICRALESGELQTLANVPPPHRSKSEDSRDTKFVYELSKPTQGDDMAKNFSATSVEATNLILYGPPGTGKTYTTAWEAVRLCLGEQVATGLKGPNQRSALMRTYRELMSEGRIEFVTFHQSMSYEEFIEGLRPTTGIDNLEGPEPIVGSSGFRLECHDGIFKRICEAARLDPGTTGQAQLLDRRGGLFKLSLIGADWRDQLSAALSSNRIFWGFGAGIDWSGPEYEDFQAVKSQWLESNPGTDGRAADISGTWYFRGAAEPGSYVLLTVGKNLAVALGRVVGDYEFDETSTGAQHSRRVEWIWSDEKGANRSDFYPQNFSAFQPMYQLAADRIDWDALEAIAFDDTEPGERKRNDSSITPLFTVGTMPSVRNGTFRHIAQDVASRLAEEKPDGFSLEQYREALVQEGMKTGIEPTGGWEDHNMPSWASHPDQSWLVPVDRTSKHHGNRMPAAGPESYVLIIDEINRANISKVFGELITLLEPDKRLGMDNEIRLTLPYSKKSFGVPQNLHVIGTMNTADRSIALLDTALRRRFSFKELMPDPTALSKNVEGVDLQKLLTTINGRIEYLFDREHQIGHAYFTDCQAQSDIERVMRDKVIPLLAEYFYEDWSKVAAVLGDTAHGSARFLEAKRIAVPPGMTEDDFSSEKLRWTVKDKFDLSEFAA